jgi:hypothetical protein
LNCAACGDELQLCSGLEPAGPEEEVSLAEEEEGVGGGELEDHADVYAAAAADYDDAELHWNASSSG